MKSTFRATTPSDAQALSALLTTVFDPLSSNPGWAEQAMFWKYWSPHPFWSGSRSYVLENEGRILAHGAVVPQWGRWKESRFRLVHLIDWAATPGFPGVGASLFRRVLQLADAGFVVGGSDMTQHILPSLGFRDVGKATRYARPLHSLRRLTRASQRSWRTLAQFARSLLWAAQAPGTIGSNWELKAVSVDSSIELPLPPESTPVVCFERTPEVLTYLASSPLMQTRIFEVEEHSKKRGYFLLATVPGQVRIADSWLDSSSPSEWCNLYLMAAGYARECSEAAEVVTVVSDDLRRQALQEAGFHSRGDYPIRFFTKNPGLQAVSALRCEMIDSDAAYAHLEEGRFWA